MRIDRVLETCLYVDDLEAAQEFHSGVLGLEVFSAAGGRDVFFRCGRGMLLLFDPSKTRTADSDVPPHGAAGAGHVAFAVETKDLDGWRRRLREHRVPVEQELTWPGGGQSIYFRDPAGNSLELATPSVWNPRD